MIAEKTFELTRREFMQLSGGAAAVLVLGSKLFGETAPSLVETNADSADKLVHSYC